MLDKLVEVENRFDELERLLADPDLVNNRKEYSRAAKERADLEDLVSSRYPVGALTVKGDSMIDDQICDGDWVIFEQRSNPRNGETVVALVDASTTTRSCGRT